MASPGVGAGRLAIGLGLVSAAVHGVLAVNAWERSAVTAAILVVMAVACLACAPSLWRGGSVHTWMTMVGLSGVMLFAHWQLCFACGPEVHHSAGRGGLVITVLCLMAAEMALASASVLRLTFSASRNIHSNIIENNREVLT
jgi:hypothetical protein